MLAADRDESPDELGRSRDVKTCRSHMLASASADGRIVTDSALLSDRSAPAFRPREYPVATDSNLEGKTRRGACWHRLAILALSARLRCQKHPRLARESHSRFTVVQP